MTETLTLPERVDAARLAVSTLERANGSAALDGTPTDPLALSAARMDLEALEEAEREAARRQAHTDAELRAAERDEAAKALRAAMATYAEAVARCEPAAVALIEGLKATEEAALTLRRAFHALGRQQPTGLEEAATRTLMSRLVIGEFAKRTLHPSRYGDLRYSSVPTPVWSAHVEKVLQPAVESAIQGTLQ